MEWRPFELHPEIPPEGVDWGIRPGGRREAYFTHLRELAAADGLPLQPPARVPNSHRALEAAEFARDQGAFDRYHRALFDAYFGQGHDIGDIEVLAALASDIGLDAGALRQALETRRYAALVDERTEEARRWGVTGTPTFIFEAGERRFPIIGAQEYAVFANVAQRMGAERRTQNLEPSR